jgi:hypothetical protein
MGPRTVTGADRTPAADRETVPTEPAPGKMGRGAHADHPAPASIARVHNRTPQRSPQLKAQTAENNLIKAYSLVEAERDKRSATLADADPASTDASKAPGENATFERDRLAVIDAATENLRLQNALNAEAKQALADAERALAEAKQRPGKPDKKHLGDDASENYDTALADSKQADDSVKTAERLLLKASGTATGPGMRGLAVAAEDKLVEAFAKVRIAEDFKAKENIDTLDKPLEDLAKASDANLKAWAAALKDAQERKDKDEINACRIGHAHAITRAAQVEQRISLHKL